MVRPGDRTSFIAGGDGCVPGVFEPEGVFVRISDRKITIHDTVSPAPTPSCEHKLSPKKNAISHPSTASAPFHLLHLFHLLH